MVRMTMVEKMPTAKRAIFVHSIGSAIANDND